MSVTNCTNQLRQPIDALHGVTLGGAAVWASDFRSSGRGVGSIPGRDVSKAPRSTQPSIPPG